MKKIICIVLCVFLIPCSFGLALNTPELPRVVDTAGLLTDSEVSDLTDTIENLTSQYQMDVVILTVDSLGYKTAQEYADDYYDENGYGVGIDYSGVLLLISMEDRDWWISTCGNAVYAITDYGVEALFKEMSSYLSLNMFYEAFCAYLDALPKYFHAYNIGAPIDGYVGGYDGPGTYTPGTAEDVVYYKDSERSFGDNFLISLLIGLAAAAITVLIMRGSMNTKRAQHSAAAYFQQGSFNLRIHRDLFLYSNVSKIPRPKDTGGSSGGGSRTHSSSSGRSHGGGGGKF